MPRKRVLKKLKPWDVIHAQILRLQERMRPMSTGRDYYNMCYFGTEEDLRTICILILNSLDSLEQERQDGDEE